VALGGAISYGRSADNISSFANGAFGEHRRQHTDHLAAPFSSVASFSHIVPAAIASLQKPAPRRKRVPGSATLDLFGERELLPGLRHEADFLSPAEEQALLRVIERGG
jgi:hypothetical protein